MQVLDVVDGICSFVLHLRTVEKVDVASFDGAYSL